MAGRHAKDETPAVDGTDVGTPFQQLSDESKGAEFDASLADPEGYAMRNFSADQTNRGHNVSGTTSG